MTGRPLAASALLALVAAALAAAPARGQTALPPNQAPTDPNAMVQYFDPANNGQATTIRESERRTRVTDLRELLGHIDSGRLVILTTGTDRTLVATDRLPKMAAWLVSNGKATPAEAAAWVDLQKADSRRATEALRKELQALQAVGQVLAPAAGEDVFPDPMDWLTVRGLVRGRYRVPCRFENDALPPLEGAFTLEFVGDGNVRGIYESDRHQYQTDGTITLRGSEADVRGKGAWSMGSIQWTADWDGRVRREGNRIVLAVNAGIRMRPSSSDTVCDPGTLVQTD